MHLPRLLFLLLLLALTGCETVRYRMIPPPSESGRFCVTQCAGIMEMCIGHERSMAQFEQRQCEHREDREYDHCMRGAENDRGKEKKCKRKRDYCSLYESVGHCKVDYRSCYSNCGGLVIKEVEKW